jgi:hypothetical protein
MRREFEAERKNWSSTRFFVTAALFTEDLRPTSFGPNDIDNIDEAVEVNFGLLSKKAKRGLK